MAAIPEKLQDLLDAFDLMEDRQERIDALIETAHRFKAVPEEIATRPFAGESRVPHCESEAYVFWRERADGTLDYYFAVENPQGISAMAVGAILQDAISGAPPEQVLAIDEDFIYKLFGRELSMGKSMGLMAMVQMCKAAAKHQLAARGA